MIESNPIAVPYEAIMKWVMPRISMDPARPASRPARDIVKMMSDAAIAECVRSYDDCGRHSVPRVEVS